jgi:hypothetical protein
MSTHLILRRFIAASFLILPALGPVPNHLARPQIKQRKIVSDDFTRNRAGNTEPNGKTKSARPQQQSKTYRPASSGSTKPSARRRSAASAQLGITIWRLRPMTARDKGPTVLVKEGEQSSPWVAERVASDTVFNRGDFVRLSIESAHQGYLYVVNREQFADGTTGDPFLIYPWSGMVRGENRVQPGLIVDIPSAEDDPSYFLANPTTENQPAELVTIIITKAPLNLSLSGKEATIPRDQFAQLEKSWSANNQRFEMEGGVGQLWTEAERQAASRFRARRLTRSDPAPQTIFRIEASNNRGYLVNIRLAYAK